MSGTKMLPSRHRSVLHGEGSKHGTGLACLIEANVSMVNRRIRFLAFFFFSFAILAIRIPGSLLAQDASLMVIIKTQEFFQPNPYSLSLREEEDGEYPLAFFAMVEASDSGALSSARVVLPSSGGAQDLADSDDPPRGEELVFYEGFDTLGELNSAYPNGSYTFEIVGLNDIPSQRSIVLDLMPDSFGSDFRGAIKFTSAVYQASQIIDASLPFEFQWDPIEGGEADDFLSLQINDMSGDEVYQSPEFGSPNALDGTATSATVPGGALSPGTDYEVKAEVFHRIDSDESYTTALSAFGKSTTMLARTLGGIDSQAPFFYRSAPRNLQYEVELNAIVAFCFNEAMDTSIVVGQAIEWTGVPDANLFEYRWSPNGGILFCHYPVDLPPSSSIQWALNSPSASSSLRDVAGNALGNDISGSFRTSAQSSPNVPDVSSLLLIKGKVYEQTDLGIMSLESYFAGMLHQLNGISSVSSIGLGIPGAGADVEAGTFSLDHKQIRGDANFAETSDLDRLFPNGTYTLSVDSMRDGAQSVSLNFAPVSGFPSAPSIDNLAAAQSVDNRSAFLLQWEPWTEGTPDDFIFVVVQDPLGNVFFESPGLGESNPLDGAATSVTIPADALPPGATLEAEVAFVEVVDSDTTQYPGVAAIVGQASITDFEIQTTGEPFKPRLEIIDARANSVHLRLTGVLGQGYEIHSADTLPGFHSIGIDQPFNSISGYKASFDYLDSAFGDLQNRFYQARSYDPSD